MTPVAARNLRFLIDSGFVSIFPAGAQAEEAAVSNIGRS